MLNENIKNIRKSKGLSQDELAIKLNVVRQTISKWEKGLSVPDSEMLIALSEVFEVPVSTLLGEKIEEVKVDDLKVISEKLEVINLQLAQKKEMGGNICHGIFITMSILLIGILVVLRLINSSYLSWDNNNLELAVAGTILHGFEWIFIRIFPFVLIGLIVGVVLTRKRIK